MGKRLILVVEDNALNREALCTILKEQYETAEAENGRQALEILNGPGRKPDLILLDVLMPVMDGYEFLDALRAAPTLSAIPVIVTTQGCTDEDELKALSHGANDFVTKPCHPQILLNRVANQIRFCESGTLVSEFKYDWVTGLYSTDYFYRCVEIELREHPEREYTLIAANVINFKLYNDVYGQEAGDELLAVLAKGMMDTVGDSGFCGRLRADRFAALQERSRATADRRELEERLRRYGPNFSGDVTLKWGVYEIDDRTVPVPQMCDRALMAMRSIRPHYDKFVGMYNEELRTSLLRSQKLTQHVRSALAEGQFVVYFQPKRSLLEDRMIGAEALVRWNHPELGFISPGEFIPLFERSGFISRLDHFVWETACRKLKEWQARGLPVVPVSVNVSRVDVYQSDLPDVLSEMVERIGVDPSLLHLEITESAYTGAPERLVETVDRLREKGFTVEMDDFGSGYSSLNALTQMRMDVLKLDMQFVRNETSKPERQSILRFVVEMAHWMGLTVVAEGVETWEQADRLRAIHCDAAQGYCFARPMPAADFEKELESSAALEP